MQDFGLCYITVQKVKAHVALARIMDGSVDCSWLDRFGNNVADMQAKQGAACHPVEKDLQQTIETCRLLVTGVARWLGTIGNHLMALDGPDVQAMSPKAPSKLSLELTHIPACTGGQAWRPIVLHKEAKNILKAGPELQEDLMAVPVAVGPQGTEVEEPPKSWRAARGSCSSHALRTTGQFVFCRACGGHKSGRSSTVLRASCDGTSNSTGVRRLREGRHPVTGSAVGLVQRWNG